MAAKTQGDPVAQEETVAAEDLRAQEETVTAAEDLQAQEATDEVEAWADEMTRSLGGPSYSIRRSLNGSALTATTTEMRGSATSTGSSADSAR